MGQVRPRQPLAADLYQRARARGHDHPHAVRVLARAWVDIIWPCWTTNTPTTPPNTAPVNPSSTKINRPRLGAGQHIGGPGKRVASGGGRLPARPAGPFPDRSAHGRRAVVSVGSSGSSVGGRIIGTRDEYGILFVSCLVVLSCHLAPLVPARPRYSGHSCLSWPRLGRARTCLIVCGRAMSLTGTVGAATRPTPTGGSGIPARWCDSRLSLSTSTGTHGSSTPTRTRRTCLGRPAVMGESTAAPEARPVTRACRGRASVGLNDERGRRPRRLAFQPTEALTGLWGSRSQEACGVPELVSGARTGPWAVTSGFRLRVRTR